jgi:hypothetical protein
MDFEKGELEFYVIAIMGASIIEIANHFRLGLIAFCGLTVTVLLCLYVALTKFPRKDKEN